MNNLLKDMEAALNSGQLWFAWRTHDMDIADSFAEFMGQDKLFLLALYDGRRIEICMKPGHAAPPSHYEYTTWRLA